MGLLAWIVIGGLAGWIASMIMGTNREQGCLVDIIVGIVGAFIGGFLANILGIGAPGLNFSFVSLLIAVVGAVVLLAIVRAFRR